LLQDFFAMRYFMLRPVSACRALAVLALVLVSATAQAAALATPEDQLRAMRRIQCSATDGVPAIFTWHGHAWSRVPGEPDRRLFKVEGVNVRQCGPLAGSSNPAEFRLVSREILLYEDPDTGEVLRTWQNPWTGKTVEVLHVANDPVNGNYGLRGRDGKPVRYEFDQIGNQWWLTTTVPLFYPNPLGGAYQPQVGGTYHATEMFNFFGDVSDLRNARRPSAQARVAWQRMSSWLPWMEMGDRPGLFYANTAGRKVDRWEDLPPTLRGEIEKNYPDFQRPPPLDDQRPNETSWTYFKKITDRKRAH
jgi:Protein of unknown function (DUF1838)